MFETVGLLNVLNSQTKTENVCSGVTCFKKRIRGSSVQCAIFDFSLSGQILHIFDVCLHPIDGEKRSQIGGIRRDHNKDKKPPNGSDDSSRSGPQWDIASWTRMRKSKQSGKRRTNGIEKMGLHCKIELEWSVLRSLIPIFQSIRCNRSPTPEVLRNPNHPSQFWNETAYAAS